MNTLEMLNTLYLNDKAVNLDGRIILYNEENKLIYEDTLEPFKIDLFKLSKDSWEIEYEYVDFIIALNAYKCNGNDIVLCLDGGNFLFINGSYDSFEKLHCDGISLLEFINGKFRIVPKLN